MGRVPRRESEKDILWVEGLLVSTIDADSVRGDCQFKEELEISPGHFVDINIHNHSGKPLSLYTRVGQDKISFCLNFRKKGDKPWFRVDNDNVGFLHFHLETGDKSVEDHQRLSDDYSISKLIISTFQWAKENIQTKYPDDEISNHHDFIGFV